MRQASRLILGAVALFFCAACADGAVIVTTLPVQGALATRSDMGQLFIVPATAPRLRSFEMYLFGAGAAINFRAVLYPFNEGTSKASGPALYTSATQIAPQSIEHTFTFNLNDLLLQPGGSYLFTLTQANLGNPAVGNLQVDANTYTVETDHYPAGRYLTASAGLGGTATWQPAARFTDDLAFTATFDELPEPSGFAALLGGMLVLRRRCYLPRKMHRSV